MKIHEYQAKSLFESFKIPTPPGKVAFTADEAKAIAKEIGGDVVVKAQVHVGGRGKAGGVKLAKNADEAYEHAKAILGMDIKGLTVKKVLVVKAVKIKKEYYLGMLLDRSTSKIAIIFSEAGGVDIEEVAAKTPERILQVAIDPMVGFKAYNGEELFRKAFPDKEKFKQVLDITEKLYRVYIAKDASLAEINPLAELEDGTIMACDAKVNFDDNALYRQKDIEEMEDPDTVDPNEKLAGEAGLSYVPLDGNVGCVVNGAGLAMATMDVVKLFNGEPANFLDVGGSSNPSKVVTALKIITSNPKVTSILFNIFGGITRCDDIANGILQALKQIDIKLPIVVRLTGTNEKEAAEIIKTSGALLTASTMADAIKLAVEKSK